MAQVAHADEPDQPIDSLLWNVTASDFSDHAPMAIDGDPTTRWDSGGPEKSGQWYQIDMGESRPISEVKLDATASPNDYPRQYELSVSTDGQKWNSVATGAGSVITTITVDPPQDCRYLRITLPPGIEPMGNFWSIHELHVYGPAVLGGTELPRPAVHWHEVKPIFPTRDIVMAAYNITDFGIDPTKDQDTTQAIILGTRLLGRAGGGTLWFPTGHYRLSSPIVLPANVTLRGDWTAPQPGKPFGGTVLEMTANAGDAEAAPGISLFGAAAVKDITFWYPNQNASSVVPYPVTVKQFGGTGMDLEDITFVNAYRGFACGPEGCAMFFLRNIYGTVLETGIKIDSTSDIGRMEKIRLSPHFWSDSGLPGAPPANGPHAEWMAQNGTGIAMRRNDWSYAYDVDLDGYNIGFHSLPSLEAEDIGKRDKNYPNGNNARFRFTNCKTAIECENVSDCGMMFYDTDIIGSELGIVGDSTFTHTLQIQNSRITASKAAIQLLGSGQILLTGCVINGPIQNDTGYVGLAGCTPAVDSVNGTSTESGQIKSVPYVSTMPVDPYNTSTEFFGAGNANLAVVTDDAYGAKGDSTTDDTDAVKKAIAAVATSGGTVFFPPGEYRITSALTVPTGVELRGVSEGPHSSQTRGSILDVAADEGNESGPPFLTVSAHAGVRGLTFNYPDLDTTNVVPYPWMIRGAGQGVWLINLTCTVAYRMVDLATIKCDDHFVDYVAGHALREAFRIGGGSNGGRLLNCQLNPSYYSFTSNYPNSPSKKSRDHADRYSDATEHYAKDHADAYVIGDCTNEIVFQNFVFGVSRGLVLTGTTTGPSGWCLGQGGDQCRWSIWADRIGAADMPLINEQVTTVDSFTGEHSYIGLDQHFTGTLNMLGFDAWGGPAPAIGVNGGNLAMSSVVIAASGSATFSLKNKGAVSLTNAYVRNPSVFLDRDQPAENVNLSNVMITGPDTVVADKLDDLPQGMEFTNVAGSSIGVPFAPTDALPTTGWEMDPSANSSDAHLALDGDESTRWTTARPARSGDKVDVQMDDPHVLTKVRIDTVASPGDYPRAFQLYLSMDGTNWGDPVAAGQGSADLRIGFTPRTAKYIRLVNLGNSGGFWSIHEFQASDK
jgi:F5/8 type C domain/Pectate lyase superfamily protein